MAKVLVVDDNQDMLTMLRMLLERRGPHQVIPRKSGEEGLEAAFDATPDLAIVDVMMPGMDGYEVVRRLRANPSTKEIPIIILTARGQAVDREAALKAGANHHMSKPVDNEVLLSAVNELIEKQLRQQAAPAPQAPAPPPREQTTAPAASQVALQLIFPVLGYKGGVGVSTVALNLALLMQNIAPTILWDLSPNSGHAALMLGIRPQAHWGQYLQNPQLSIPELLIPHSSGVRLLAAPPIPGQISAGNFATLSPATARAILAQIKPQAPIIVMDMPPALDEVTLLLLDEAYRVLLVTGDEPTALQTTMASLQALQKWHSSLAVVRNCFQPGPHPKATALQRALHISLSGDIPYDAEQATSVRKGQPLALSHPNAPMVTAIKRLAQGLLRG